MVMLIQLALFAAIYSAVAPRFFNLDFGELIYRLFLSFYGLLFPAYVWIRMWPRQPSRLSAASIPAIVPILIAAPMYWLGFIQNRMLWLLPAVAVVVLFPYLAAHRQRPAI